MEKSNFEAIIAIFFGLGLMMASFAIGFLLISIAIYKEPKLLFILPFKASRIAVINKAGLPFFSYNWNPNDELIDDTLFSSMLTGISGILQESLRKGDIREIHLAQAVLLIKTSDPQSITFVLVSSRSSQIIRNALDVFAERFLEEYSDDLTAPFINQDTFQPASKLVEQSFPFIPER